MREVSVEDVNAVVQIPGPEERHPRRSFHPILRRFPVPWSAIIVATAAMICVNVLALVLQPYFMRVATYDLQHTTAKLVLYQDGPRPDIVVMGSSRALSSFDPAIIQNELKRLTGMNERALNLSITGAGVDLEYLVLKNVIRADKQPKVIIYGLSEYELNSSLGNRLSSLPYTDLLLRPSDMALYSGSGIDNKVGFLLKTVCPICRDNELIRNALSIQFNPDDPWHKNYADGPSHAAINSDGFFFWPASAHPTASFLRTELYGEYRPLLAHYQVRGRQLVIFQKFLALARARGIKVVLVNLPVASGLHPAWQRPADIDAYLRTVRSVAARYHIPLLDMYNPSPRVFPARGMYDLVHPNSYGADILSRLVTRQFLAPIFGVRNKVLRVVNPPGDVPKIPEAPINAGNIYHAAFSKLAIPSHVVHGGTFSGSVVVRNTSDSAWPVQGIPSVRVAYHWLDSRGHTVIEDGLRTYLTSTFKPKERRTVHLIIASPPRPGHYILSVDLVYETVSWFSAQGNKTLNQGIVVTAR